MLRGKRNDMRKTDRSKRNTAHATAIKKSAVRRNKLTLPLACCAASATICATPAALFHQPWSPQSAGKSCDDDEGIAERSELVFTSFSAHPEFSAHENPPPIIFLKKEFFLRVADYGGVREVVKHLDVICCLMRR